MNFNWTDASNGLDLIDHALIGFVLILVTAIPSWFANRNHKAIQSVGRKADTLVVNVQNGHTEPMRADLDKVIQSINALGSDIRGLRYDLTAEGELRRQQFGELRTDLDYRTGKHRR